MGRLAGKSIVMVIAPKDFKDQEYFQPKVVLQAAGAKIDTTAKTKEEEATGVSGGKAKIDKPFDKIRAADYAAIVLVGGEGARSYFRDQEVLALVKKFHQANKVIAAICIAPVILANAGILEGKKASVFASEKRRLEAKGAKVTPTAVQADGLIVTANGPEAALEFGQKLLEVLTAS